MERIRFTTLATHQVQATDEIYDSVRFARTNSASTRMAGALLDGAELVGIGRLIDLGLEDGDARGHFELGGMWVEACSRRQGIAGGLIDYMLDWVRGWGDLKAVWCTPFADLMPLYGRYGFVEAADGAPAILHRRLQQCTSAQERPVLVTRWDGLRAGSPTDSCERYPMPAR